MPPQLLHQTTQLLVVHDASRQDTGKQRPPGEGKAMDHHRILVPLTHGNTHSKFPRLGIQQGGGLLLVAWGRCVHICQASLH